MKNYLLSLSLIFFSFNSLAQEKFTISGYVKDNETGEYLIGATVYIQENLKGISTNQYGFYSLTIEKGSYTINYSFLGLKSQQKSIVLDQNLRINVALEPDAILTQEVIIESEKADKNVQSTNMSQVKLMLKISKDYLLLWERWTF